MGPSRRRRAFTLVELLVVITIILLISIVALPTIVPALSHRQVSEGARLLQSVLAGARDSAIRDNAPSGIRLLPDPIFNGLNPTTGLLDPTLALCYNRIIPIQTAPAYSEGLVNLVAGNVATNSSLATLQGLSYPGPATSTIKALYGNTTALVVAQAVGHWELTAGATAYVWLSNSPTSWFWNIRVGDKIQINNAGPWYTVVGPMSITPAGGNPEWFVNVGAPGVADPWSVNIPSPDNQTQTVTPEFLFLVDGRDDNRNAWVDEGWDGVDNDGVNGVDDIGEWVESETWQGAALNLPQQATYTIQRRPAPTINAREIALPSNVVIDATTWGSSNERTRVPGTAFDPFSGFIDVLVNPDGSVVPTTLYSVPTSLGLTGAFFHFWLAERSDIFAPAVNTVTATAPPPAPYPPFLPISQGLVPNLFGGNSELKGENRIVTLFTRTGQITTNDNPTFDLPTNAGTAQWNTSAPFVAAQQGIAGNQQ